MKKMYVYMYAELHVESDVVCVCMYILCMVVCMFIGVCVHMYACCSLVYLYGHPCVPVL